MPRIDKPKKRWTKFAQAEGAPHPYSSYNYRSQSDSEIDTSSSIPNDSPSMASSSIPNDSPRMASSSIPNDSPSMASSSIPNNSPSIAHNESTAATIETPKTPLPKLSFINPRYIDPNSIPHENQYIYDINRIRRERDKDKFNYVVEDEATKKSKQEFRKKILHEMANPENEDIYKENLHTAISSKNKLEAQKDDLESKQDFNKNDKYELEKRIEYAKQIEQILDEKYKIIISEKELGRAILSRIDLEEQKAYLEAQKADLESKQDLNKDDKYELEDYKYELKNLENRINRAKLKEKISNEDYTRKNNEIVQKEKENQIHNTILISDWTNDLLTRSGYMNAQLTSKTEKLYSYLKELYKQYLIKILGENYLEDIKLTDNNMFDATKYMLSQLDKERFEKEVAEAELVKISKGGKTNKRRSKRNRKSRRQRK